ncbi:MAG: ester cyclase [Acidimicrobiia bacterium]|nr:ester cyclase [Acidimicrobiia bacterium]
MDVERNKASMRRVFEEGFSQGRVEVVHECLAPDAEDHHDFAPGQDFRDHLAGIITMLRGAMPDLRADVEDLVAEGDRVAARVTLTGTYTGEPFGATQPQGQRVRVEQFHIVQFDDEARGVRHWANVDEAGLFAQLGADTVPV